MRQYEGRHQLLSDVLSNKLADLANSAQLVAAGADDFRDACLHRQLTVQVNAEIPHGFHRVDDRGTSIQGQVTIS